MSFLKYLANGVISMAIKLYKPQMKLYSLELYLILQLLKGIYGNWIKTKLSYGLQH